MTHNICGYPLSIWRFVDDSHTYYKCTLPKGHVGLHHQDIEGRDAFNTEMGMPPRKDEGKDGDMVDVVHAFVEWEVVGSRRRL